MRSRKTSARRGALAATALGACLLAAAPASAAEFSNPAPITIQNDVGNADLYPSTIDVSGAGTYVTDVDVTLDGVFHEHAGHFDIALVAPSGRSIALMSDACESEINSDLTFDAQAPNEIPATGPCGPNAYRPSNHSTIGDEDGWPGGVTPDDGLSDLNGEDPNGEWQLYVYDDAEDSPDNGKINGGWSLSIDSRAPADVRFPIASQTVREGDTLVVDIVRGPAEALGAGSIVVGTSSGTAQAGSDFVPVSQTLSFAAGETVKTVSVPVIADGGLEPAQDFSLVLGQPEGDAYPGTPSALGVTIPADAQQPASDLPPGDQVPPGLQPFRAANTLDNPPSTRRCRRAGDTIVFRPKMPPGVAIMRSEVFVGRTKIEDNVGEAAVAPIVLTMTGKRMRVRIRLHSHDGRVVTIRRTFRRCAKKRG